MHNFKGYDSHLIIEQAYKINESIANQLENVDVTTQHKDISAIALSSEKFMSVTIGDLRFIDSMQFMASSLEKLVENLYDEKDKYKNFKYMNKFYSQHMDLLCQKGYYPYEWMDDIEKMKHEGLPPIGAFDSKHSQKKLKTEEYIHAINVYNKLNCKTFEDYHMTYLKCDVLLLADVFENFRITSLQTYELDPANYLSAPALGWDALLLISGVALELISDLEILDMIERQKRGGLCFVGSKRHEEANNKYLDDYDTSKPSNYIIDLDANNLYGYTMCKHLPIGGHKFIDKPIIEVLNTSDINNKGYTVKLDFSYPEEIHDEIKEYQPAPENIAPYIEWFSKYQVDVGLETGAIKYNEKAEEYRNCGTQKLIPHLYQHKNYVIDYRNLKYLVKLGIQIDKVHKIMTYTQEPWMKSYIELNTAKRKKS